MHISFLDYLVDPATGESLTASIEQQDGDFIRTGSLSSSRNTYPIIRGIPRFAGYQDDQNYTQSFGYQWQKFSSIQFESKNIGKPMEGHTRNMWEKITGITGATALSGSIIGDFGCGTGRFMEIVTMKQGRVIGIDLSASVEVAAEMFRHNPHVLIIQGDILNPPIKPGSLDGAFSIGVLHHTPDPPLGFAKMIATIKPGGWGAIAVYGKGGYYDWPTVRFYRGLFKALWPKCRHYPPLIYSYLTTYLFRPLCNIAYLKYLGQFIRFFVPFVNLPDRNWSLLDTFDSVTPAYQSAHESYEVFQWFKANGCINIEPTDWGFTSYRGNKP